MTYLVFLHSFISELYAAVTAWITKHPDWFFLPSLYFCFATFKIQFNGNILSGWKITFYIIMGPCMSETGCWMEMEIFHILSVCGSVKNVSLSFCVKSQEGGCNCKEKKGEAQSHSSESWGAQGSLAEFGGVGFWPQLKLGCASYAWWNLGLYNPEKKQTNKKPTKCKILVLICI